jgi:hypothetical protein
MRFEDACLMLRMDRLSSSERYVSTELQKELHRKTQYVDKLQRL